MKGLGLVGDFVKIINDCFKVSDRNEVILL